LDPKIAFASPLLAHPHALSQLADPWLEPLRRDHERDEIACWERYGVQTALQMPLVISGESLGALIVGMASNQPIGFELPGGTGDEDLEHADGRNCEQHAGESKQNGAAHRPEHHH